MPGLEKGRMNVILIGFMGGGKTTIGRKLARRLGYHFLDMDEQIENEQKCKISEIFAQKGEKAFRYLETQLLKRLLSVQNTVIATGGGVIVTEENIDLMKRIGTVIYIKASIEDIIERVTRSQHRPLLSNGNPEERVRTLIAQRTPMYEQADQVIETKNLSSQRVTSLIIQNL